MSRQDGRGPLAGVLGVCLLLVAAGALPVAGATVAGTDDRGVAPTGVTQTEPTATPTPDNDTERHERPSDVDRGGDTERVRGWLERGLLDRLGESSVRISQSRYESASGLLGGEFEDRLGQYVDVAGETDGGDGGEDGDGGNSTADRLRTARDTQRELANESRRANETYREYRRAREAGDETAARSAARELRRQADRLQGLNRTLARTYRALENDTGIETDEQVDRVANVTRGVVSVAETVENETFVTTRLSVATNRTRVGFDRPARIVGRLSTPEGALVDRPVRVRVGARTYSVRTNATGRFALAYRPVALPVGTDELVVAYRPAEGSPYLPSNGTASVSVERVRPALDVTVEPTQAGYGDGVAATVGATVDGRPVSGLVLRSSVAGEAAATGRTGADGRVVLERSLPAAVTPGERTVRVVTARPDAAVGGAAATATLVVERTETALTVDAGRDDGTVAVTGRLRTVGGDGVGGRTVAVDVAGRPVGTATTGADGRYELVVDGNVTAEGPDGPVTVGVRFDGAGTNLESAVAETSVAAAGGGGGGGGGGSGFPVSSRSVAVSAAVAVGAGVALLLLRRRVRSTGTDTDGSGAGADGTTAGGSSDVDGGATGDATATVDWLGHARAALADGAPERAAATAYRSVRDHFDERVGVPDHLTHREFLDLPALTADDEERTALRTVVDAYERATFDRGVDVERARSATEAAARLVGDDAPGEPSTADD